MVKPWDLKKATAWDRFSSTEGNSSIVSTAKTATLSPLRAIPSARRCVSWRVFQQGAHHVA